MKVCEVKGAFKRGYYYKYNSFQIYPSMISDAAICLEDGYLYYMKYADSSKLYLKIWDEVEEVVIWQKEIAEITENGDANVGFAPTYCQVNEDGSVSARSTY